MTSAVRGRRSSSSTARRRSARRTSPRSSPSSRRAFLVHLPDARGHGRTRWDAAEGFRYDWLVDDLVAFVDGLGIDSFHVLGFSMGAMTALQFGARYPERLRTMVVVGITTLREPRASVGRHLMDPARILEREPGVRRDALAPARRRPGARRLAAAPARRSPRTSPRSRSCRRRELHAIDCPAMVVCGDRDPFVPPEHAAGLARQLPHGRLFVAPDCGHEVTARRPGLFNEAIGGFYRSTEAEATARAERAERAGSSSGVTLPRTEGGPR